MCYLGAVAIEPVKVVPEVGLDTWELQELAFVACSQCVLKEIIVMQGGQLGYICSSRLYAFKLVHAYVVEASGGSLMWSFTDPFVVHCSGSSIVK